MSVWCKNMLKFHLSNHLRSGLNQHTNTLRPGEPTPNTNRSACYHPERWGKFTSWHWSESSSDRVCFQTPVFLLWWSVRDLWNLVCAAMWDLLSPKWSVKSFFFSWGTRTSSSRLMSAGGLTHWLMGSEDVSDQRRSGFQIRMTGQFGRASAVFTARIIVFRRRRSLWRRSASRSVTSASISAGCSCQ